MNERLNPQPVIVTATVADSISTVHSCPLKRSSPAEGSPTMRRLNTSSPINSPQKRLRVDSDTVFSQAKALLEVGTLSSLLDAYNLLDAEFQDCGPSFLACNIDVAFLWIHIVSSLLENCPSPEAPETIPQPWKILQMHKNALGCLSFLRAENPDLDVEICINQLKATQSVANFSNFRPSTFNAGYERSLLCRDHSDDVQRIFKIITSPSLPTDKIINYARRAAIFFSEHALCLKNHLHSPPVSNSMDASVVVHYAYLAMEVIHVILRRDKNALWSSVELLGAWCTAMETALTCLNCSEDENYYTFVNGCRKINKESGINAMTLVFAKAASKLAKLDSSNPDAAFLAAYACRLSIFNDYSSASEKARLQAIHWYRKALSINPVFKDCLRGLHELNDLTDEDREAYDNANYLRGLSKNNTLNEDPATFRTKHSNIGRNRGHAANINIEKDYNKLKGDDLLGQADGFKNSIDRNLDLIKYIRDPNLECKDQNDIVYEDDNSCSGSVSALSQASLESSIIEEDEALGSEYKSSDGSEKRFTIRSLLEGNLSNDDDDEDSGDDLSNLAYAEVSSPSDFSYTSADS